MTLNPFHLNNPVKLSVLRQYLANTHPAKKTLSQNFLIDENILTKIINLANLVEGDLILEIGPGPGALTKALLDLHFSVVAVEKDAIFAQELKRFQTPNESLISIELDFLKFDLTERFTSSSPCKVLGNLPYHLTTDILKKLIEHRKIINTATLMIQKEVALKLTQEKPESFFQLLLQITAKVYYGFSVSKNCFFPKPQVDSAVIHVVFERDDLPDFGMITKCAKCAFQQKRKQLKKTLSSISEPDLIVLALKKIQKKETSRPQDLSAAEWIRFCVKLKELS